jgi:tagatose-1,6-bisphosphate aldolase
LSAIATGVPWVLLSAGVDFPTFQRQAEIACEAGASGVVVGRAVWAEALEIAADAEREWFLNTIAVSRMRVLNDTVSYRATAWFERVGERMPQLQEGWYRAYEQAG